MYYLIVNVSSGSGKGKKTYAKVKSLLDSRNIEYKAYKTERLAHATEIMERIGKLDDPDKRVIVVGGDGSINEAVNGIKNFDDIKFGVVPTGSGNDFVRGHKIKGSTEEILDTILNNDKPIKVDIGLVKYDGNERYFAISSGVGLDALVCKKAVDSKIKKVLNKIGLGKLTYGVLTVLSLVSMKSCSMTTKADDKDIDFNKAIFSAAMILRAEGGGVPMAPDANYTDGELSICTAANVSKFKAIFALISLLQAKHAGKKAFTLFNAKDYTVKTDTPQVLHTDGEYIGEFSEVSFSCLKEKLILLNETAKED